jgi:hypothetical protein
MPLRHRGDLNLKASEVIESRRRDFIGDANSRATVSRDPEYHDEESHN